MAAFGPTHYDVRPDIARLARHVCSRYGCTWNTYRDHPPGLGLDYTSVDFWGTGGRGDSLSAQKRRKVTRFLKYRNGAPYYRWIINGGHGYYPNGATFRPPGGAEWNAGHVHVTYW